MPSACASAMNIDWHSRLAPLRISSLSKKHSSKVFFVEEDIESENVPDFFDQIDKERIIDKIQKEKTLTDVEIVRLKHLETEGFMDSEILSKYLAKRQPELTSVLAKKIANLLTAIIFLILLIFNRK
jgi:hypothetical protein